MIEETETAEYRFTHALMQETLYDELIAARRVRLHGEIATRPGGQSTGRRRRASTRPSSAQHLRNRRVLNRRRTPSAP